MIEALIESTILAFASRTGPILIDELQVALAHVSSVAPELLDKVFVEFPTEA